MKNIINISCSGGISPSGAQYEEMIPWLSELLADSLIRGERKKERCRSEAHSPEWAQEMRGVLNDRVAHKLRVFASLVELRALADPSVKAYVQTPRQLMSGWDRNLRESLWAPREQSADDEALGIWGLGSAV